MDNDNRGRLSLGTRPTWSSTEPNSLALTGGPHALAPQHCWACGWKAPPARQRGCSRPGDSPGRAAHGRACCSRPRRAAPLTTRAAPRPCLPAGPVGETISQTIQHARSNANTLVLYAKRNPGVQRLFSNYEEWETNLRREAQSRLGGFRPLLQQLDASNAEDWELLKRVKEGRAGSMGGAGPLWVQGMKRSASEGTLSLTGGSEDAAARRPQRLHMRGDWDMFGPFSGAPMMPPEQTPHAAPLRADRRASSLGDGLPEEGEEEEEGVPDASTSTAASAAAALAAAQQAAQQEQHQQQASSSSQQQQQQQPPEQAPASASTSSQQQQQQQQQQQGRAPRRRFPHAATAPALHSGEHDEASAPSTPPHASRSPEPPPHSSHWESASTPQLLSAGQHQQQQHQHHQQQHALGQAASAPAAASPPSAGDPDLEAGPGLTSFTSTSNAAWRARHPSAASDEAAVQLGQVASRLLQNGRQAIQNAQLALQETANNCSQNLQVRRRRPALGPSGGGGGSTGAAHAHPRMPPAPANARAC